MKRLLLLVLLSTNFETLAGTLAQFRTPFGTVDVELYDAEKPGTVQNFKRLVQLGAYQNTFIHRLVPGFVAQGGGFRTYAAGDTNLFGPPWGNLNRVPNLGAISNEFSAGPLLSNTNGTLAMAKLGDNPDSATSEWFFSLTNNAANLDHQNGGFTVFGHVIRDAHSVLPLLNSLSYFNGIQPLNFWYPTDPMATNLFTTLPVVYAGMAPPRCSQLVYVDVTLLQVQITKSNGLPQISWTSVAGRTNVVEFTTTFPPAWQTLGTVVGTGSRIAATDPANDPRRFYRVRVLY